MILVGFFWWLSIVFSDGQILDQGMSCLVDSLIFANAVDCMGMGCQDAVDD